MTSRDSVRRILVRNHRLRALLPPSFGRLLDVLVAVPAVILFLPLMLLVAAAIVLERRGPVIFRHERIGKNGSKFLVLQFRSMRVDADGALARHLERDPAAAEEWRRDHKLRDDPRITRLGRVLRKTSLDELPQFINVLRGEMSIVGPRPIVVEEVGRYGRYMSAYCSVRPGITGIWQVSGRNEVTYRRRVLMDALYARRKCVLLDVKIILATIPAVLTRRGSY